MFQFITIVNNKRDRNNFATILEKMNVHNIPTALDYNSFIRALQYKPQLIILECDEQTISQMRILRLIRRNPEIRQIPIVAFGPKLSKEALSALNSCDVQSYQEQPLNYRKLFNTIRVILGEKMAETAEETPKNQMEHEDEQLLFNDTLTFTKKLDLIEKHIGKLLAFPTTVTSVMKITGDQKSSASQLSTVIESDSSVSAEILRLANSVMFAARNKRITSIKEAIIRIGFDQTKTAAMSMSVMQNVSDTNFSTGFNHSEFWCHSLAVAIISEELAKRSNRINRDEAFVFGLLHELGVLLYNEYLNNAFLKLLDRSTAGGFAFKTFQKEELNLTHNDLQARLFERWAFSSTFVKAVKQFDKECFNEEALCESPHAVITSIADCIAHTLELGRAADVCISHIPPYIQEIFGLTDGLQEVFIQRIYRNMNMYNSMLKIDTQNFPRQRKTLQGTEDVTIAVAARKNSWEPLYEHLKLQGYRLLYCHSGEELLEVMQKEEAELFFCSAVTEELAECLGELKRYRGVLFDPYGTLGESFSAEKIVKASYPVDLRNVDLAIHALHHNHSAKSITDDFNRIIPQSVAEHFSVLIAHPQRSVSVRLRAHLQQKGIHSVRIADTQELENAEAMHSSGNFTHIVFSHELPNRGALHLLKDLHKTKQGNQKFIVVHSHRLEQKFSDAYRTMGVDSLVPLQKDHNLDAFAEMLFSAEA